MWFALKSERRNNGGKEGVRKERREGGRRKG